MLPSQGVTARAIALDDMTTEELLRAVEVMRAKAKKMDRLAQEMTQLVAKLETAIMEGSTTTYQEAIENEHHERRAA